MCVFTLQFLLIFLQNSSINNDRTRSITIYWNIVCVRFGGTEKNPDDWETRERERKNYTFDTNCVTCLNILFCSIDMYEWMPPKVFILLRLFRLRMFFVCKKKKSKNKTFWCKPRLFFGDNSASVVCWLADLSNEKKTNQKTTKYCWREVEVSVWCGVMCALC